MCDGLLLPRREPLWGRRIDLKVTCGHHQLYRPISRIEAGTRTSRTTVASRATATAMPSPSCCTGSTPVKVNAVKTAIIRKAAPEMSGAVATMPLVTAFRLSYPASVSSRTLLSRKTS